MKIRYLILDLDNTLYPQDSGMLQAIDRRIDDYIAATTAVPAGEIPALRQEYCRRYGTTIGGLVLHQGIQPQPYFEYAYDIDVASFVRPDPQLAEVLRQLELIKIVFSNSPLGYVEEVLATLGIRQTISRVYDIHFSQLVGKPSLSSYRRVLEDLGAEGAECILVDDVAANLAGAAAVGMTPVLMKTAGKAGYDWEIGRIHDLGRLVPEIMQRQRSA
ncbi:putative hydrolase of the HAD superfamily [Hydrogenispora ethanolica]|uniref:Putative hydrolase of the HAD superfamily n=1 Tax=Hydrogenispora ethanolica TaxID=1082276 RepID=A0A4R1R8P1_HYDET|nr:HAD-IA family hydrolase [Hydrogenispora ethanolica]TCL62031.1 putative hydrolase of the HAD superfamily [Hydrogenispora ethanolica]